MKTHTFSQSGWLKFIAGVVLAAGCSVLPTVGSAQILSLPYPEPSTNGALHYNRAILAMSIIPVSEREVLSQPIWEAFGAMSKDEIHKVVAKLVYEGRHAIRAALHGCEQPNAEFGIDYADYGHGAVLPHAQPMLQLGRLITLAGIHAQIEEKWEESAVLFFQCMRIGRHMTDQPTLVETLVGVEILENNYYALAFWASKCPEPKLVKQAFLRFEIGSRTLVQPVKTMAYEASIVKHQIESLRDCFPNGPWSERLLESLGQLTLAGNRAEHEAKAKQICCERGVPAKVFEDKATFDEFVDKINRLQVTYLQASAACMDLPPKERLQRGKLLMNAYEERFREIGDEEMMDIQKLGAFFAVHEAEQTMLRVALAVAASRTEEGLFPPSLEATSVVFAGKIPRSPYDGSELEYQVLNDGKDFSVAVPEVIVDGVTLSRIDFSSVRETSPKSASAE